MHAYHNAGLLRSALPRHHTKPKPLVSDSSALHEEWARQVQIFGPDKRRQAVEKAAATRAKNKVVRRKQAEREKRQETAVDQDVPMVLERNTIFPFVYVWQLISLNTQSLYPSSYTREL